MSQRANGVLEYIVSGEGKNAAASPISEDVTIPSGSAAFSKVESYRPGADRWRTLPLKSRRVNLSPPYEERPFVEN